MADATLQISGLGTHAVPLSYDVPPAQSFTLLGVRAVFDGAAAGGAFLPCLQIFSSSGNLMAQTVGSSVAAGAAADVTFAPFLESEAAAATGGGIQFDVNPQQGDFLDIETEGPSLFGLVIRDNGPGGLYLRSTNNGFLLIQAAQQCLIEANRLTMFSEGDIELNLATTLTKVVINDSSLNPIFEFWEDGSVHGLASVGAITWDL